MRDLINWHDALHYTVLLLYPTVLSSTPLYATSLTMPLLTILLLYSTRLGVRLISLQVLYNIALHSTSTP